MTEKITMIKASYRNNQVLMKVGNRETAIFHCRSKAQTEAVYDYLRRIKNGDLIYRAIK